MKTGYDVLVSVTSVKHKCLHGHKVGDKWLVDDNLTPAGICLTAFCNVLPVLRTMRHGGTHWFGEGDVFYAACPDPYNLVLFELKRLPTEVAQRETS